MSEWKIAYFNKYHLSEAVKEANAFLDEMGSKIIDIKISVSTFPSGDSCCLLYKIKKSQVAKK